eukprot:1146357-Pelagomonas_calceolata.AAC.7
MTVSKALNLAIDAMAAGIPTLCALMQGVHGALPTRFLSKEVVHARSRGLCCLLWHLTFPCSSLLTSWFSTLLSLNEAAASIELARSKDDATI